MKKEEGTTRPGVLEQASFPDTFLQAFAYTEEKANVDEKSADLTSCRPLKRQRRADDVDLVLQHLPRRSTRSIKSPRLHATPAKRQAETYEKAVTIKKEEAIDEEYLPEVPDYIKEDVDILIIGSNPGRMSSRKCQHFSHPSNHFYRALHQSGLTPTQLPPSLDYTLVSQVRPYFSLGLTNLVARPTRMAQDLDKSEEAVGTEILIDLIRRNRPKVGIFIGIGVSRGFERSLAMADRKIKAEKKQEDRTDNDIESRSLRIPSTVPLVDDKTYGLGVGLMKVAVRHAAGQGHTLLYAMPSTSGRVTTHQLKDKAACMAGARLLTSALENTKQEDQDGYQDVQVKLI